MFHRPKFRATQNFLAHLVFKQQQPLYHLNYLEIMFSVPGWNVAAQVKTQVEAPKPKESKPGKKAQKRKEKREEQQVNADNLAEQWESIASGKGSEVVKTQKAEAKDVEFTDEAAQEKRGKKRKRGKAGGNKDKRQGEDGAKDSETEDATAADDTKASPAKPATDKPTTADAESKRDKKKRKKESKADKLLAANANDTASTPAAPTLENLLPEPKGLTPLQRSMRSKLASARFRHLNEALYTKPSADSASLFKEDPSMFEDYHRGFAQQVEVWPSNPVDSYVNSILVRSKLRPKDQRRDRRGPPKNAVRRGPGFEEEETTTIAPPRGDAKPLPRDLKGHSTIADLGCGTASLSYRLQPHLQSLNLTFHSFDLSQPTGPSKNLVTVADIKALPLPDNSVDVAIFCLALMGTNWLDFIDEAYRILRWKGELWVSEIKSRFGRVDKKKGGVPINSIGSLKKNVDKKLLKPTKKQKADKAPAEGPEDSEDEAELAVVVDGQEGKDGTDVSAFIDVLRKRGFVLDALPERPGDAIDLSNKMFVKMQFVKAAHPSKGKNARDDQKAGAVAQRGGGMKFGLKGKRMSAVADEEEGDEKEKAVLKPCLYKIR
ncbi:Ribosomal RNA-processing protein 8 [Pyrenophora tritici-repentis]|nr:Ribosomal RNA-processing protein 8 [Pyrenophora tritici-repentis]KAI0608435.1 Ribosomal RNA-processing protein 8 [Pyrenophora tritici-repentis]KAI1574215.1 ribosomal RNA-processing protein 8 [Pyrenophora tritici-repentis]